MPSCGLAPGARLVAAACVRAVRQRLASGRGLRRVVAGGKERREGMAKLCLKNWPFYG